MGLTRHLKEIVNSRLFPLHAGIHFLVTVILAVTASAQRPQFAPDKVGIWKPFRMSCDGSGHEITTEQNRVYSNHLLKLSEAIHQSPIFNPPMGIDGVPTGCVNATMEFLDDYPDARRIGPIPGYLMIGTFSYAYYRGTTRVVRADEGPHIFVDVNSMVRLYSSTATIAQDERGKIFLEPKVARTVSGLPLYESDCLVITQITRPIFQPVSVERFLLARIRETQKELADYQHRHQDLVGEAHQRSEQKSYQWMLANRPADAEKIHQSSLLADAHNQELFTKLEQSKQAEIASYQSQLASLSPEQRSAQAYASLNYYANGKSLLMNANQPGARPLVAFNPNFFDHSRPRTDFQSLVVGRLYDKGIRDQSYDPQYGRLVEFRKTFDFRSLVPLLGQ